jgi:hypothetical protein
MFGIGSTIYEGLLSVEIAISVGEVHGSHSTTITPTYQNFYKARLFVYNVLVFAYGLVCVVVSNVNNYYGEENVAGYLCYIPGSSTKVKIMGVMPVLLSVTVMFVLNIYSWWMIVSILKNLVPNSDQDQDLLLQSHAVERGRSVNAREVKRAHFFQEIKGYVSAAKRLEPATRRNVFRMLCIPLMYVLVLVIPSVIIHFADSGAIWAYTVAVCSVISTATVNFICWVVLDDEALGDLMHVTWSGMMTQRESGSSVNSNRPRSVDGDSDGDDAVRAQLASSKAQQKRDSYSAMSAHFLYSDDDQSGKSLLQSP